MVAKTLGAPELALLRRWSRYESRHNKAQCSRRKHDSTKHEQYYARDHRRLAAEVLQGCVRVRECEWQYITNDMREWAAAGCAHACFKMAQCFGRNEVSPAIVLVPVTLTKPSTWK